LSDEPTGPVAMPPRAAAGEGAAAPPPPAPPAADAVREALDAAAGARRAPGPVAPPRKDESFPPAKGERELEALDVCQSGAPPIRGFALGTGPPPGSPSACAPRSPLSLAE
jgi:hypothetical protein